MSLAELGFAEIWVADYEFRAGSGETPIPVCLVAKELISGQQICQWADEMGQKPPYSLAEDSLFIAYYATAEFSCHLALGWQLPANVIDAYVEFRNVTNGRFLKCGSGLLGALAYFGEDAIDTLEKEEMRALVMRGGEYTAEERQAILAYCESDVVGLEQLVRATSVSREPTVRRSLPTGGNFLPPWRDRSAWVGVRSHQNAVDPVGGQGTYEARTVFQFSVQRIGHPSGERKGSS